MSSKKTNPQTAAKPSSGETPASRKKKLSEKDLATVTRELSGEELKDLSGGSTTGAIPGEAI